MEKATKIISDNKEGAVLGALFGLGIVSNIVLKKITTESLPAKAAIVLGCVLAGIWSGSAFQKLVVKKQNL